MNTKRLVTVAVLIALYTVLSLFSANLGLIKLTFESFPVLVASLMFGWVDGLLVGAVGGLLNQMLTYGFTVTTLMWILPNAVRGLLVGLYAKKHGLDLTMKQTAGIVLATSLLVTGAQHRGPVHRQPDLPLPHQPDGGGDCAALPLLGGDGGHLYAGYAPHGGAFAPCQRISPQQP